MELVGGREKKSKGLIKKTWESCKSFSGLSRKATPPCADRPGLIKKSKSWPRCLAVPGEKDKPGRTQRIVPEGCFSVYVGPDKERFVIRTRFLNHPLFKALLEEAESEFGYSSEGPLVLPCGVDVFVKVLAEVDCDGDVVQHGCTFARAHSSYHLLTPPRYAASIHSI